MTAPGLLKGFPDGRLLAPDSAAPEGNVRCWDNVHWWGARRPGEPLISTPGAFHAAHIHWRWGSVLESAKKIGLLKTGRHFDPDTWSDEIGTSLLPPLVDPGIFMQTIRIAVTKNHARLNPERTRLVDLSDSPWESLFETGDSPPPEDIHDGGDIVLWYSSEVHREVTIHQKDWRLHFATTVDKMRFGAASSGTVFLHGIFFAHNAEPGFFSKAGDTKPHYRPRSESEIERKKKWFRPAG